MKSRIVEYISLLSDYLLLLSHYLVKIMVTNIIKEVISQMIQSLERCIEVLEAMKQPDQEFTIAQLSKMLQLPPSTLHRILATLCAHKYVVKDDRTHTYRLGPAFIPLSVVVKHNMNIQENIVPALKSLSSATGEDAFFIIPFGYKGVILEKSEGTNPLKVVDTFGYERYLHCGAIRKTLLAYQSESFIRDYIKNALPLPDSLPKTSEEKLINDIKKIRENGIGISHSEYIQSAIGIGAPVFGFDNEIKGTIGIIFLDYPAKRHAPIEELMRIVKVHGYDLSASMGYSSKLSYL